MHKTKVHKNINQKSRFWRTINLFIKRVIDLLGSGIGLIVLSPLLIIIGILIKITAPGPVFFTQERLGYKGKVFKIIKFRTMIVNAEHIGNGLKVKDDSDNRITPIGRFLRKTSMDELPQLINVVKGDMSLVGPRPPVTYYPYSGYEGYSETAKHRFDMRPGMTGLAQVKVRNSATWDERIVYDLDYVKHFNVMMDIRILFGTVATVLSNKNIYLHK